MVVERDIVNERCDEIECAVVLDCGNSKPMDLSIQFARVSLISVDHGIFTRRF